MKPHFQCLQSLWATLNPVHTLASQTQRRRSTVGGTLLRLLVSAACFSVTVGAPLQWEVKSRPSPFRKRRDLIEHS